LPKDENLQSEWKEKFLLLLHPFAPHIAEELFQNLKKNEIKKAYFATGNKNKFSRLQMVIEKNNLSFSISEYKDYKEVEETGITPLENTLQKLEPYKNTKRDFPIIATDS
jgi:leucyl-tRNA synthetase